MCAVVFEHVASFGPEVLLLACRMSVFTEACLTGDVAHNVGSLSHQEGFSQKRGAT